jgi:WD40 repeat protein
MKATSYNWARLNTWLSESQEFLLWRRRLRASIAEWDRTGHDKESLLRGTVLAEAEGWLSKHRDDLAQDEAAFIEASVSHRKEQGRQRKRRKRIVTFIATGIIIALLLAGFAGWQWWEAKRQEEGALVGQLAAHSKNYMSSHPQRSLLLAAAGIQQARKVSLNVTAAQQSLLDSLSITGGMPFHRYEAFLYSVAFSPDNKRLASGSDDSTVRIWDLTNPKAEPLILRHEGAVYSVTFSPYGKRLASGSGDNTVRVWDLTNPKAEPLTLHGHEDYVYSVAFSPDSKRLASGSWDKTVRIWDLDLSRL